jgi:hypothetical protein
MARSKEALRERTGYLFEQLLVLSNPTDAAKFPRSVQRQHADVLTRAAVLRKGTEAEVEKLAADCLEVASAVFYDLYEDDE